jgi:hypothetical protein
LQLEQEADESMDSEAEEKGPPKPKSGPLGSGIVVRNFFVNEMASAAKYAIPSIKHLVKWIPWSNEPPQQAAASDEDMDHLWGVDHNIFEDNEDDSEDLRFLPSEKPKLIRTGE